MSMEQFDNSFQGDIEFFLVRGDLTCVRKERNGSIIG